MIKGILQYNISDKVNAIKLKVPKRSDTIVKKEITKITYQDGKRIEETTIQKTNLTKKMNESAKLIKEQLSTDAKLEEIYKE